MKKTISFILAAVVLLTMLTACGGKAPAEPAETALYGKVTMENANLNAIMAGLDSVLLTIDNTGIIRNWNANAEKYFDKE